MAGRENETFAGHLVDLRSDTLTRPTAGMREAMAHAEVGDDVFGEDPTVNALEEEVASITGKEASLFVPSGTMGNQLAIACHTRPGDEVIIGEGAHVAFYEVGASAALSGVQFVVAGSGGFFTAGEMLAQVKPEAYYFPKTSLVALENTHNRGGGTLLDPVAAQAISDAAHARGIAVHLDGARLWNASVASGIAVDALARPFDTVSVCFSKGLGAPVGSALAGPRDLVRRARRLRKMWGGGMRQAGILAAAARYALTHHRARLALDHANALAFSDAINAIEGVFVDRRNVVTNIVNVDLPETTPAERVAEAARRFGVALNPTGPHRLRAVTHLDVSHAAILIGAERLGQAIAQVRADVVLPPRPAD